MIDLLIWARIAVLSLFSLVATAGFTQAAGTVTLVVGSVEYQDAAGARTAVKKNQTITANTILLTGPDAIATIRFWDGGSLSVRPASKVLIKSYAASDISKTSDTRFVVESGSARFISSSHALQNKDRFRVNTPVAAIGIRGTDFVVTTTDSISRVMVNKGAVAAAPFDSTCLASTVGPCSSANTVELSAALLDSYLEIQPDKTPQILRFKNNHKELFGGGEGFSSQVRSVSGKSLDLPIGQSAAALLGESFLWGRNPTAGLAPEGYEVLGSFQEYVILRKTVTDVPIGNDSVVSLRLKDVDANVIHADGRLERARVAGARLRINLAQQTYVTRFSWSGGGQQERFFSQGQITKDGRFDPRQDLSNVSLYGGITSDAQEAAYLFSKKVGGVDAIGVLGWRR